MKSLVKIRVVDVEEFNKLLEVLEDNLELLPPKVIDALVEFCKDVGE